MREKAKYVNPACEIKEKINLLTPKLNTSVEATKGLNQKQLENIGEARLQVQVGVSEKLMIKLRRVQDLLSQEKQAPVNLEDTFEAMAQLFIQRRDPLEKAKRQKLKGKLQSIVHGNDNTELTVDSSLQKKRRPIAAAVRHQLMLDTGGQCSYVGPVGKRCAQRRYLQIHHKIPVEKGGNNDLSNLSLLCFGHHKSVHERINSTKSGLV